MLFLFSYEPITLRRTAPYLIYILFWLSLPGMSMAQDQENKGSKTIQNLTARYNILFNAREAIKETEQDLRDNYPYNYNQLLPVLLEPHAKSGAADQKKLDEAIDRCKKVANEKSNSKYVDDAYLLIGMANHLKTDYYNSVEFFNYVGQNYPKEKLNGQTALIWKARSLIQLEQYPEAGKLLDSALRNLKIKTLKASALEAYATAAQFYVQNKDFPKAANLLARALKASPQKQDRLRWTYLLAQLEQQMGKLGESAKHYQQIVNSNAPFEMYFNAKLNRISIEEAQAGRKLNREKALKDLLKDDKNIDFTDQIYYHIARYFENEKQIDKAISNYNVSLRKNSRNQTQKALTYLALAELYFNTADYLRSKKYYDSTLSVMPKTDPDFESIRKKGDALELLARNLSIIAEEDSLQALAALPQGEREKKVAVLLQEKKAKEEKQQIQANTGNFDILNTGNANRNSSGGKFYFSNPVAISQGFADFRTRWGTRQLEDNWRRSQKSMTDQDALLSNNTTAVNDTARNTTSKTEKTDNSLAGQQKAILDKVPDTPEKLAASNERIADAWFEVGSYYREVMNEVPEAIRAFENLLKRHPAYKNRAAVYYNLYRLYAETEPRRSEEFKQKVLQEFPNSNFAKVILDPEFGRKQDERDLALTRTYDQIFALFSEKKYTEVQAEVRKAQSSFGQNRLSAQLDYLQALAAGHQQSLQPFEAMLKNIVSTYPDDKLITPLVKQHLEFIEANRKSMATRIFALMDKDPNNLIWAHELPQQAEEKVQPEAAAAPSANAHQPGLEKQTAPASDGLFDLADREHFYMIINVTDPSVNLSSSRFGIGQFNRANLPAGGIKHQLIDLNGENQLISIGEFSSLETITDYYNAISPLMKDIMKVPAENYSLFLISKANLERIKDRQTLSRYLEFYQKNFK